MSAAAFEQAAPRARVARFPLWPAIVAAALGSALLTLPRARAVWSAGEFYDSDDAMRAVQVRDWLAGQSWFDMNAYRVDPPAAVFMHWTRIVDVPLAALDLFFGLFLSPETAERATRLAFPLICLIALLALAAWTARALRGEPEGSRSTAALEREPRGSQNAAAFLAVWLIFLSAPGFGQFAPGRIDHHAPQILLLMATIGLASRGFDPATPRALFIAAASMALSCAVSLENLPFFIVLIAAVALLFVQEGARAKTRILCFALGLLFFFPLCFAAVVAPSRYALFTCDAFSAAQLCPVLLGAAGLGALALASPRLVTAKARAVGVALVGAMALATIQLTAPQCFGHPLGVLDPLLRDLWLSHVTEAKPLLAVADDPATLAATAAPVLAGLAAALALAFRAQGVARRRWAVLAATIVTGFAAALWQIRVVSSVTPLAMVALACAIAAATRTLRASALLRGLAATVAALAVSPMGLALALHSDREAAPKPNGRACLESAALAPLATLAPARIAAPIDMGAHLLAFTPHSVFAAPYHRDNHGGRIVVDAFLAPPAEAEALLRAAGADLLLWCGGGETAEALQARAGLAAALARGETPAGLAEIPLGATPVRVFALRPAQ
ncbi:MULTISPECIES: hypothetical protein [Methylosinus]|uniref:Glycosyltransferase RgtA/B/C/D-like domain-containing protein n=1 Tax=Methylosinus trichosporium (strain ATCC 35070 / NCIMB 11131 / UNIQEM 75 / OB3b) TaxID=595536 RepID=A0A2D2D0C6_METT3|nr:MULTISPECIES: hypothetical protein [Methylosinus]ATQ68445.1 hypothetical protein CQW49_11565 [Methylosinus trichosporium OB3b]OBS51320.1 hypothetical protein A8B73_16645 [Methylosinus sp. 3S-1]